MANVLKIKAGSGVPTTSDIVDREIAFNRSDNKLYINDSGTIVNLSGAQGGGSADEADRIVFDAQAGEALSKGDVVYISGISGNTPIVSKADADDANKMPSFGLAAASASLNNSVQIVTFGTLENFDTSSFTVGDIVYVSTTAGVLTATKPTGESGLLQNIGFIVRSHASTGAIKISGAGRTAATPNLNQDKIFLGNASNQSVSTALSSIGLSKFNNDLGFGGGANRLITDDGDGTVSTEANLTFDGSALSVTGTANVTSTLSTDYGVRFNNGNTDFMFYNNTGDNLLYLRDLTNSQMLQTWTTSSTTIHKNLSVSGNVNATGDINVSDDVIINVNANYIYLRDASSTLTRTFGMNSANNTYIGPIDAYAGGSILYGISSNVTNQIFYIGGSEKFKINSSGDIIIQATNKLYLDGGGSTYITESAGDLIDIYSGGVLMMRIEESGTDSVFTMDNVRLGVGTHKDLVMYHNGTNDFIDSGGTAMFFRQGTTEKIKFNSAGNIQFNNAQADINTRFATTGSTNTLWIDGGTDRVGIGTNSPDAKLEVTGGTNSDLFSLEGAGNSMKLVAESGNAASANVMTYRIGMEYLGTYTNGFIDFYRGGDGGSGFLTFGTSGTEKMRIDGSGNVGIGVTSPTTPLHVAGLVQIAESGETAFYGGNYVRMFGTQSFTFRNSGGSIKAQIGLNGNSYLNGGNVGINATSPSAKLHVGGDSFFNGQLRGGFGAVTTGGTADWNHSTNARSGNGHTLLLSTATNGPGTTAVNTLNTTYMHTLNFEYASYDGDANMTQIGIPYYFANLDGVRPVIRSRYNGTWSQWHSIPIANQNGSIQGSKGSASNPSYVFNQGSEISEPDTGMFCPGANMIGFSTGGIEKMRIDSSGNVGIGTTSPPFKLKVNVADGSYTNLNTIAAFQSKRGADTETEVGIAINSTGDGLVGSISSNLSWSANTASKGNTGRSTSEIFFANSGTDESTFTFRGQTYNSTTFVDYMKLDSSQSLHVDGDVVAYSTTVSDKRLKDNVETIDNALNKVMKLRGVEFDWNATSRKGQHDIGLIAQEVEEIIPEIVREKKLQTGEFTDNEKTFKTVDYDKMVGVLIEAIKEQQQQINELKEKLNG